MASKNRLLGNVKIEEPEVIEGLQELAEDSTFPVMVYHRTCPNGKPLYTEADVKRTLACGWWIK